MAEIDISEVEMNMFTAQSGDVEVSGCTVEPKSDEKSVFIPSPPSQIVTKINPRPAVIYLVDDSITPEHAYADKLKEIGTEQKLVFVCPDYRKDSKDSALSDLKATYEWIVAEAKSLNIKKDEVLVKSDDAGMEFASAFCKMMADEDVNLGDAEKLVL